LGESTFLAYLCDVCSWVDIAFRAISWQWTLTSKCKCGPVVLVPVFPDTPILLTCIDHVSPTFTSMLDMCI
jgi:hypothetical protein